VVLTDEESAESPVFEVESSSSTLLEPNQLGASEMNSAIMHSTTDLLRDSEIAVPTDVPTTPWTVSNTQFATYGDIEYATWLEPINDTEDTYWPGHQTFDDGLFFADFENDEGEAECSFEDLVDIGNNFDSSPEQDPTLGHS
jgi:hypothetical protein